MQKSRLLILPFLIATVAVTLAPSNSLADVLKCQIDGYLDNVFITTPPDTNSSDGQFARVGISAGIGNKAMIFPDRMGATAFVELNGDGTPIGLITIGRNMRVVKSRQSIDPSGAVAAPSQGGGSCAKCATARGC